MITAYFTLKEKYLSKDDYRKDFEVDTIEELLSKIKIDEEILLKSDKKHILEFLLKNKNEKIKTEIVEELPILDFNANYDFDGHLKLRVPKKWQALLGNTIHIVKDIKEASTIFWEKDEFAFPIKSLSIVKRDVLNGEISVELLRFILGDEMLEGYI